MVCVYERADMLSELWCRNYGVNLIWKWIKAAFPSMTVCALNSAPLCSWILPGLWRQSYILNIQHHEKYDFTNVFSRCVSGLPLNVHPLLLLLAPLCSRCALKHTQTSRRALSVKWHSPVFDKQHGCCVFLPCAKHQSQQEVTAEHCLWRL